MAHLVLLNLLLLCPASAHAGIEGIRTAAAAGLALAAANPPAETGGEAPEIKDAGPVDVRKLTEKFEVLDLERKKSTFGDALKQHATGAKVVLIDTFATWCDPCQRFAPYLAEITKQYKGKGLAVIAVSSGETFDDMKRRLPAMGEHPYPIFSDGKGQILDALSIKGFPTVVLMKPDGELIAQGDPRKLFLKEIKITQEQIQELQAKQDALNTRFMAMRPKIIAAFQKHQAAGGTRENFALSGDLLKEYEAWEKDSQAFEDSLPKPPINHEYLRGLLGIKQDAGQDG